MANLNKVQLIGNLGNDPDIRYTASGQAVVNFNIATTEKWKNKEGEKQERTEWHRIVIWGKLAEICGEYLTKGSSVYLEGKIQSRKWEDKDGTERTSYEIICHEMQMLGSKSDNPASSKKPDRSRREVPPPEADDGLGF